MRLEIEKYTRRVTANFHPRSIRTANQHRMTSIGHIQ